MAICRLNQIYEVGINVPYGFSKNLIIRILKEVIPIFSDGGRISVEWGDGEKSDSTSVCISKIDFAEAEDHSNYYIAKIHIENTITNYDLLMATKKEIEHEFEKAEQKLKALKEQKDNIKMMFPDKTIKWEKYGISTIID